MVLLDTHQENHTYSEFEGKIKILHHPTTIKINYVFRVEGGGGLFSEGRGLSFFSFDLISFVLDGNRGALSKMLPYFVHRGI